MTTCTPGGLPVVEGSDRPCDIDDWSCDFAAAVESRLDTLDSVVNRTFTTIPAAWLHLEGDEQFVLTVDVAEDRSVTFTNVIMDTDNLVSLDENASGFNIGRDGLYYVWFAVFGIFTSGSGTMTVRYRMRADQVSPVTFETATHPFHGSPSLVPGETMAGTAGSVVRLRAGDVITLEADSVSGTSGNDMTMFEVDFGIVWVGDVP